jgi:hypothetical protein
VLRTALVVWCVGVGAGLGLHARRVLTGDLPAVRAWFEASTRNTRLYLGTGDRQWMQEPEIPYPSADVLVARLSHPELTRILPVSVARHLTLVPDTAEGFAAESAGEDAAARKRFDQALRNQLDVERERGRQQRAQRAAERDGQPVGGPTLGGTAALGVVGFLEQSGSAAQQLASTIQSTLGQAVYSISDGIYSWITGIGSAKDAALAFAQGALRTIIDTVVRIGIQQIINATVGAALQKAAAAAAVAIATPTALALGAIWAGPATLATIATLGGAAAQAPASILTAKGIVLGSSLAGFAEGGYTGDGARYDVKGLVHAGEYVMPADIVRRLGVENLDAIRYGAAAPTDAGTARGGMGYGSSTILVDSRREAARLKRGSMAEADVLEIVQQNRYRMAV